MASLVLTGDTSGQVTIAAPAVAGTTTLTLPATTGTMLNDATVGVCRAWVNFNGTGTVAIRASFNVSSITDNGTGNYTVNFTTAMPDVNYAVNGTCNGMPGGTSNSAGIYSTSNAGANANITTALCQVYTGNDGSAAIDCAYVSFAFFR